MGPDSKIMKAVWSLAALGACFAAWYGLGKLILDYDTQAGLANALEASGAFFTALAFFVGICALWFQKEDLRLQREELKATREELKGQREQMEIQNRVTIQNSFENSFFNMVSLQNDIISKMVIRSSKSKLRRVLDGDTGIQSEKIYVGRECFSRIIRYFKSMLEDGTDYYNAFAECYLNNQHLVGHYFNNLQLILCLVKKHENNIDSLHYASIIRAQLSARELELIFHFGIAYPHGAEMKPLIERYALLANLDRRGIDEKRLQEYSIGAYDRA